MIRPRIGPGSVVVVVGTVVVVGDVVVVVLVVEELVVLVTGVVIGNNEHPARARTVGMARSFLKVRWPPPRLLPLPGTAHREDPAGSEGHPRWAR